MLEARRQTRLKNARYPVQPSTTTMADIRLCLYAPGLLPIIFDIEISPTESINFLTEQICTKYHDLGESTNLELRRVSTAPSSLVRV